MDDEIRRILHQHFNTSNWTVTKPKDGQQKACFVAHHNQQDVFIKFDVPIAALQRLGEIGVAPRMLASGRAAGRSYVVQEYIVGSYPDWRWFASHLPELAAFTSRYHHDQPLTSLLAANTITSYHEHIAQDLATLENTYTRNYISPRKTQKPVQSPSVASPGVTRAGSPRSQHEKHAALC